MGFDWSHDAGHFYRALLESFSYDFSLALERVDCLYPEYTWDTVKMIGGGAKSVLWPEMAADITGKKSLYHEQRRCIHVGCVYTRR